MNAEVQQAPPASLLDLATAYATWVNGENDGKWVVFNDKKEPIGFLPAGLSEKDAMSILKFGRGFEVKAFNVGINFGKTELRRQMQREIDFYKGQVAELSGMNERLSEQLEQFISGET